MIQNGDLQNHFQCMQQYFMEIAEGLNYIHSQKIIHRDLKPENIFLTANDRIKIGDFGLSSVEKLNLKKYSKLSGTAYYIPPGRNTKTSKLDMYAFGIITFEMCHRPFTTGMERDKILNELRNNRHIPSYLRNQTRYIEYLTVG